MFLILKAETEMLSLSLSLPAFPITVDIGD